MTGRKTKTRGAKPRVVWTDFALRDLERIEDHIAEDRPVAASRWVQKLMSTAETAAAAPLAGRVLPERPGGNIREVLLRHYRIAYVVRDSYVEVLTVFEGHKLFPEDSVPSEDE